MLEHIDNMKTKMNPLANQVNRTMERIRNLTIGQLSRPVFIQLDQWRKEMHETIDDIHRRETKQIEAMLTKNKEMFDEHKREQAEAMMKVQRGVKRLLDDGDVTFEQIESLENQLRRIESSLLTFEKNFLLIETRVLPDRLVTISSRVHDPPEPILNAKLQQPATRGKFPDHFSVVR